MTQRSVEKKILCLTPTPGKSGTRIEAWKYEAIRRAIRKVVPKSKAGLEFSELVPLVSQALSEGERQRIGSIVWYTVTVKLHLEVVGELERIPGKKRQWIRRVK